MSQLKAQSYLLNKLATTKGILTSQLEDVAFKSKYSFHSIKKIPSVVTYPEDNMKHKWVARHTTHAHPLSTDAGAPKRDGLDFRFIVVTRYSTVISTQMSFIIRYKL